jgi:hypothetical protein
LFLLLLLCAVQALLDWHQLAYLIFSAAAPLTARGASMLLALLLTTPQSTLSWVPLECIVGSSIAGRATVVTSIISSVYPGMRAAAVWYGSTSTLNLNPESLRVGGLWRAAA